LTGERRETFNTPAKWSGRTEFELSKR